MTRIGLPGGGYRLALRNPRFRRLWGSQACAGAGEALAQIALPLLAYDLTGSAGLFSLIFVIQLVPRVVLAPVAGLAADRLDRRRVMLACDLGRAGLVALLPLAEAAWQVAALAALVAVGNGFAQPAELAAVPQVAEEGMLVPSLSLVQVTRQVTRIVGPAAGAGAVALAGPGPVFWLQTACFLGSAAFLKGLTLGGPPRGVGALDLAGARREMAEGMRWVVVHPVVRGITASEILWQLLTAVLVVAAVVLTEETLDLGERAGSVFALLTAAFSAGATLGALVAGRVEARVGRPRLMAIGYLGPLLFVPVALVPPVPALFACWFLVGFADAWAVIAFQAYLAEAVPDGLRGRVYSAFGAAAMLAGAVWFGVVGWLTPVLGAPAVIGLAGAIVGIGGPLLLVATGAMAALRRPSSEW